MTEREERLQAAKAALEGGQPAEAVQQLASWTQKHPEEAEAWELLVRAYFELKRWPAAYLALQQLTRLRPQSAPVWSNLGIVLRHMNRLQEAVEAQTRALQLDPTLKRAKQELEHLRRLLPHASPAPAAAASAVPPASPTVAPASAPEAAEEELFPIYCRRCRRPVARAEGNAHGGLCAKCFAVEQQRIAEAQAIASENVDNFFSLQPSINRTAKEIVILGWIYLGLSVVTAVFIFFSGLYFSINIHRNAEFFEEMVIEEMAQGASGEDLKDLLKFLKDIKNFGEQMSLWTIFSSLGISVWILLSGFLVCTGAKAIAAHLICLDKLKETILQQGETLEQINSRIGMAGNL